MPVYAKQYGRLGNTLFQKAAAIGYAMKHGLQYNLSKNIYTSPTPFIITESGHQYQELDYHNILRQSHIILDGYWQSEKYFTHCREEVLKAFGYQRHPFAENYCSIHVRRGDYLKYPDKHPVVTMKYLRRAIEKMVVDYDVKKFLVFSDDLQWCMDRIGDYSYGYGAAFEYSEGRTETEDMELMSCCEHNIISNSTFSWWGAWLNQNPNKVVISPSKDNWFGPGNSHLDTSDIIPEGWIQIKY